MEMNRKLQEGQMKASFAFPAIDNYASQKSGILKGEKERQSDWDSWWNQPGVAPFSDDHRQRQLWKWNGPGKGGPITEKWIQYFCWTNMFGII